LTAAKSSLPAIRKMTVLIVSKLEQPRARRLAAWNRPPERLEEAVGLAGLGPGDDALQMPTHHGGDVFHRLDLVERMTQVHQRPSIVRTTSICRRSRISRSCSL